MHIRHTLSDTVSCIGCKKLISDTGQVEVCVASGKDVAIGVARGKSAQASLPLVATTPRGEGKGRAEVAKGPRGSSLVSMTPKT